MRLFRAVILALLVASPLAAQPAPQRVNPSYPPGVTAPLFIVPASGVSGGGIVKSAQILCGDGTAAAPCYSFASAPSYGFWFASNTIRMSVGGSETLRLGTDVWADTDGALFRIGSSGDVNLARDAANTLALKNGTAAQTFRTYGYVSGSRATYGGLLTVTGAVTLSGATSTTANIIPAGATVVNVATSTTTTITGASGYQVGDGSDADRYGDITGTAVGTASGSADGTADPRWWAASARAITLTAKTSNFTGGVVQVTVLLQTTTGQ